jgi:ribosomal protein S18 acetylase RimI-like enzyme
MRPRIRRATPEDLSTLRALRIEALTEAPEAFGSTLEREVARTPEDWRRWFSPGTVFFLEVDGAVRGMACGVPDKIEADIGHLMAMWVHPDFRGAGAADELIAAVKQWAAESGRREVRLRAANANLRARRFYERIGFHYTGRAGVLENTGAPEVEMACETKRHRKAD